MKNLIAKLIKPKPLIKQAEKVITAYHKRMTYEPTFFSANVVLEGKVEIVCEIDGGTLLGRKVCSNIEEVKGFILQNKN